MHRCLKVLAVLTVGLLASLPGNVQPLRAGKPNPVTAIDILLEPDSTMVEHAKAANQRLLKSFPLGFALDETHHPHITCLQRYVETANLDKLYEAVGKVLAEETPTSWELKAYKYYWTRSLRRSRSRRSGCLFTNWETLGLLRRSSRVGSSKCEALLTRTFRSGPLLSHWSLNVCLWHLADIVAEARHVCSWG
jgi:hypothetical protein